MSVSAISSGAAAPTNVLAAQLAARAQYQKTGIDKDAAIGDPDHDATKPGAVPAAAKAAPTASPATQVAATTIASTDGNATSTVSSATAAQAYTARSAKG
ncbi:MAG: hypothetical protein PW843_11080 [Azospirillaceae bacterium]|nr:hypothetical protein [Azospirillaceae bacterium]